MKATQELHEMSQSLWLDNITRGLLTSGTPGRRGQFIRQVLERTVGVHRVQGRAYFGSWSIAVLGQWAKPFGTTRFGLSMT
jgi:hypothetical protein